MKASLKSRCLDPTGRLDVAAVETLDRVLMAYAPNLQAVLFDNSDVEKQIRVTAARFLGPRTTKLRMVKKVAPLLGAAMRDAGLKAS